MNHWTKRVFVAAAALLLTGCLWGPGRFASDLTLKKDGSFVLDYKGEVVLQLPPDASAKPEPWNAKRARCRQSGKTEIIALDESASTDEEDPVRPCKPAELAKLKTQFEADAIEKAASKRKESEEMAKIFGIPGLDDESNRAFAAKLMKFEGWRSVVYRGKGVFDVDYHFEGRATQDFMFPMLPDNDLLIPFIAIRRRTDGSVLVIAGHRPGDDRRVGTDRGARRPGCRLVDEGRPGVEGSGAAHNRHERRNPDQQQRGRRLAASARSPGPLGCRPRIDQDSGDAGPASLALP